MKIDTYFSISCLTTQSGRLEKLINDLGGRKTNIIYLYTNKIIIQIK